VQPTGRLELESRTRTRTPKGTVMDVVVMYIVALIVVMAFWFGMNRYLNA